MQEENIAHENHMRAARMVAWQWAADANSAAAHAWEEYDQALERARFAEDAAVAAVAVAHELEARSPIARTAPAPRAEQR